MCGEHANRCVLEEYLEEVVGRGVATTTTTTTSTTSTTTTTTTTTMQQG